jgi:uncharacterized protein YabE (DUF348 family)
MAAMTDNRHMEVAETILAQLGGNRFLRMTGTRQLVAIENGLRMALAENKIGANKLDVVLDASDTYSLRFMAVRGTKATTVKLSEGVYAEELEAAFTHVTGLYTRF